MCDGNRSLGFTLSDSVWGAWSPFPIAGFDPVTKELAQMDSRKMKTMPFEPVTAVICSMKKPDWQQQGYCQSQELHRVSGIVKNRFLIYLHFVSSLGKYKTITCLNLVGMRLAQIQ